MKNIYMDYAATTPADKTIIKLVKPYFSKDFGNPSSAHAYGFKARNAVNIAREKVADFFNCNIDEIYFTSGGTESENLAIKGIAYSNRKRGNHIIISAVEHASINSSADLLQRQGFEVSKIKVDKTCTVDVEAIRSLIKDNTILVSVMYVNNEVGSIQPIKNISEILKNINDERKSRNIGPVWFHVDGEAGSIYMDYDVVALGCDSISSNGSKIYSIKGASALCVKKGVGVATQICGGGQEFLIRGGTENVPAIVAFGEALRQAKIHRNENVKDVQFLKDLLASKLLSEIDGVRINTPNNSVPNILHVTFLGYLSVNIVDEMSKRGIYISSGSACASNKIDEKSRVLQAMNFNIDEIDMSVRFSLGKYNRASEIPVVIKTLKEILHK